MTTRFTLSLAATAALVIGLAPSSGSARGQQPDAYLTPNGYYVRLYGVSVAKGADGQLTTSCDQMTQAQIDDSRFGREVSRKLSESYPRSAVQADTATAAAFEVIYTDPDGVGFNDGRQGPQRKRAFEAALLAWSKVLQGTVPIIVETSMPKEEFPPDGLARAGPTEVVGLQNQAMPTSLASQILNRVVRTGASDIKVSFNPDAQFDYALDGKPTTKVSSFVATTIHEVGHGLGFLDSYVAETGEVLNPGFPFPLDTFLNRGAGGQNRISSHSVDQVKGDLISRDLFFGGPKGIAASLIAIQPLPMPKMHAPDPFEPGSSIGHFDELTYTEPSLDLMTPSSPVGTGDDKIDPLTIGVMQDLGYKVIPPPVPTIRRR